MLTHVFRFTFYLIHENVFDILYVVFNHNYECISGCMRFFMYGAGLSQFPVKLNQVSLFSKNYGNIRLEALILSVRSNPLDY